MPVDTRRNPAPEETVSPLELSLGQEGGEPALVRSPRRRRRDAFLHSYMTCLHCVERECTTM